MQAYSPIHRHGATYREHSVATRLAAKSRSTQWLSVAVLTHSFLPTTHVSTAGMIWCSCTRHTRCGERRNTHTYGQSAGVGRGGTYVALQLRVEVLVLNQGTGHTHHHEQHW